MKRLSIGNFEGDIQDLHIRLEVAESRLNDYCNHLYNMLIAIEKRLNELECEVRLAGRQDEVVL